MKIQFAALPQMLIGVLLYFVHYVLKVNILWYNYTPFRWYFADVLALIVSIPFFVNLQIIFMKRKSTYIKFIEIVFWIAFFSIYYEIIMPPKMQSITGDYFDMIAYAVGGIVLYVSQGRYMVLNRKR